MSDTSREEGLLHPSLRLAWGHMQREWRRLYPKRPQPFLTTTYRGPADQAKAVEEGKSHLSYGQSLHNFMPALALDIAFLDEDSGRVDWTFDLFEDMAKIAKPLGLEWGGDWEGLVDGPHFQMPVTAAEARNGNVPVLNIVDPAKREREPHQLVVMLEGHVVGIHEVAVGMDVVVRYAPERRRIYVDARKEGT